MFFNKILLYKSMLLTKSKFKIISSMCVFFAYLSLLAGGTIGYNLEIKLLYKILFFFCGFIFYYLFLSFVFKYSLKEKLKLYQKNWEENSFKKVKLNKDVLTYLDDDNELLQKINNNVNSVDKHTCFDLNLSTLFDTMNTTFTSIGESFLYYFLHTPIDNSEKLHDRWKYQEKLKNDPKYRNNLFTFLIKIRKNNSFSLEQLYDCSKFKNKLFQRISFAGLMSIVVSWGIFFLISKNIGILLFLIFLVCNSLIHYKIKFKIKILLHTFRYLRLIFKAILKDHSLKNSDEYFKQIDKSDRKFMKKFMKNSFFLDELQKTNDNTNDMISYYITEYFNIFLLLRENAFYSSIKHIIQNKDRLFKILTIIGTMDALLASTAFKKTFKNICQPTFSNVVKLDFKNLKHPFVENSVGNSFKMAKKGIFITGSNMAGKTTFIRTLGINILLAQTFNFVYADTFTTSFFKIISTISLQDDLLSGKSYYYTEAERLLEVIRSSENNKQHCLCLLDEIFKGTNSREKYLATKGIINYLIEQNSIVFITTHDLELAGNLQDDFDCYYFSDTFLNNKMNFDYKIKAGMSFETNALKLMQTMNYPTSIFKEKEIYAI